jgi:hypothetical protein
MQKAVQREARPQVTTSMCVMALILLFIAFALIAGVMKLREQAGMGPVFLHPGSADAARQLVNADFANVTAIGEPAITGDRIVTLTATLEQKGCKIQLYAPLERSNDYGWTIKQVDCPASATRRADLPEGR